MAEMKALQVTRHGQPGEVLAVTTIERPEPGPNEVRVRGQRGVAELQRH